MKDNRPVLDKCVDSTWNIERKYTSSRLINFQKLIEASALSEKLVIVYHLLLANVKFVSLLDKPLSKQKPLLSCLSRLLAKFLNHSIEPILRINMLVAFLKARGLLSELCSWLSVSLSVTYGFRVEVLLCGCDPK